MAELTTLARPYARAAFEHALAGSALGAWADALSTAAAVVSDDRAVAGSFATGEHVGDTVNLRRSGELA